MGIWRDHEPTPEDFEAVRATLAQFAAPVQPLLWVSEHLALPTNEFGRSLAAIQQAIESIVNGTGIKSLLAALEAIPSALRPGSFWGDVFLLRGDKATEQEREEALRRLAPYFTRGRVFHPARWRLLRPAFAAYCREAEQSSAQAWGSLVMAALLVAVAGLDDDMPLGMLFEHLRSVMRADIERALLDGATLAEHQGRPETAWPESEEPFAVEALRDVAELTLEQAHLLMVLRPALEGLSERELHALLADRADGATRVARSRAKRKVLAAVASAAM